MHLRCALGIMVWMHVRKTRSSFVSDACASGWDETEALWWWQHMWDDAVTLDNGTAIGSLQGNLPEDSLWLAQQTVCWWRRSSSEHDSDCRHRRHKFLHQVSMDLVWLLRHGAAQQQCCMDRAGGVAVEEVIRWFASRKGTEVALADIMAVVSAEYLPLKSRKQRLCMYEDDNWCTRVRNANRIDTAAQTRNI